MKGTLLWASHAPDKPETIKLWEQESAFVEESSVFAGKETLDYWIESDKWQYLSTRMLHGL